MDSTWYPLLFISIMMFMGTIFFLWCDLKKGRRLLNIILIALWIMVIVLFGIKYGFSISQGIPLKKLPESTVVFYSPIKDFGNGYYLLLCSGKWHKEVKFFHLKNLLPPEALSAKKFYLKDGKYYIPGTKSISIWVPTGGK